MSSVYFIKKTGFTLKTKIFSIYLGTFYLISTPSVGCQVQENVSYETLYITTYNIRVSKIKVKLKHVSIVVLKA